MVLSHLLQRDTACLLAQRALPETLRAIFIDVCSEPLAKTCESCMRGSAGCGAPSQEGTGADGQGHSELTLAADGCQTQKWPLPVRAAQPSPGKCLLSWAEVTAPLLGEGVCMALVFYEHMSHLTGSESSSMRDKQSL